MTTAQKNEAIAEARFLRGHFHFQAKIMWNNVPYVDENTLNFNTLTNTTSIWPQIEADFQFAYANMNEKQPLRGRLINGPQLLIWPSAICLSKSLPKPKHC